MKEIIGESKNSLGTAEAKPGSLHPVVRPSMDEMRTDLIDGGWKPWKGNPTIWEAPAGYRVHRGLRTHLVGRGGIWRGPALAWHVMNNLPWPPND